MSETDTLELLTRLQEMPDRLAAVTAGLTNEETTRKPSAVEFSILENVWHLRDIESEGFLARIRRVISETDPVLRDLDGARLAAERRYNERDLAEGLAGFRFARLAGIAAVRDAGPHALERAGELETVGSITLLQLLNRMAEHDRGHLKEVEALRAR